MTPAHALPPRVRRLATLLIVAALATALGAVPATANPDAEGGNTIPAGDRSATRQHRLGQLPGGPNQRAPSGASTSCPA